MITQIDHIALAVHDLDSAMDAYQRMLGLEPNWIGGDGGQQGPRPASRFTSPGVTTPVFPFPGQGPAPILTTTPGCATTGTGGPRSPPLRGQAPPISNFHQ